MHQYAYAPASLTIGAGDTVTWTNHDTVAHDVVVTAGPEPFRSPLLEQGQSWSHTFSAPGTYTYICSVHPDMQATVAVAAAPAPQSSAPAPTAAASAPPANPSASTPAPGSGSQQQAAEHHAAGRTSARQPAQAPRAAATDAAATTPVSTGGSELDPLLLVGGLSIAVVVFCLLLLASRPTAEVPDP
jgi:hypothetical protein